MSGFFSSDKSNQQSTGSSAGENFSQGSGFSGSESSGSNYGIDYGNEVYGPQAGYLQSLWGQAQTQGGQAGGAPGAQSLYNAGNSALREGLNPNFLGAANRTIQNQTNPGINPMLGVYGDQVQRQFSEQIMPELRGSANMTGNRGSGRQGVAEGLAAARASGQFQDFAAQLYSSDQDRALQAASLGANIYGTSAGMVPQMAGLGLEIPWYNLRAQAGILGQPIMQDLGSETYGQQSQSSYGEQSDSSYGYNVAENQSTGKSSGFKIGGGITPG